MGLTIKSIVLLSIGLTIMAAILPGALTSIDTATTTGWPTGAVAMWDIIIIVVVASVILGIVGGMWAKRRGGG